MAVIKHRLHGGCVACGDNNPAGLRLNFEKQHDGSVKAAAVCVKELTGYDGLLHGGVAALMVLLELQCIPMTMSLLTS